MTEISRRQFAVYLVAVVLVVLLGGRALRADAGPGSPGPAPAGGFTAGASATGPAGPDEGTSGPAGVEVSTSSERLLVHVAGRVRRPGVYELAAGARVGDALAKAGGGRSGADLDALNLAAKVTDGQQVLVVRRAAAPSTASATGAAAPATAAAASGEAAAGSAAGGAGAGGGTPAAGSSVNVNQADATALEALNGVGPAIAAKIVEYRTQNGPFRTVDDLSLVTGIGPKKLEAMRAQVTL